ncbi:sulfotransferase family protein [Brevirhabdus sp.]|uniref:sulfotransferase family protein n=1 Tax=Brevirhabdus sp. TaxID=2004514 RepID=UPI004057EBD2
MSPNLFLLAAPRSGSTQLARWLTSHPDIAISPVKEPNYYASHEFPPAFVARHHLNDIDPHRYDPRHDRPAQFAVFRQADSYHALFAGLHTPWRMEASTSYLACPAAPARIARAHPGARLLSLTRDPVERALSHYRLALRTGRSRHSLLHELTAERTGHTPLPGRFLLRPSRQAEGLKRIAAQIPPARHLPLRFEDMVADPAATLTRIAAFLDIDPHGFDLRAEGRNAGARPRLPRLNRLLLTTGLKTWARRNLPATWKPALKRLFLDETTATPIPLHARAALRAALKGEDQALAALHRLLHHDNHGQAPPDPRAPAPRIKSAPPAPRVPP